MWRKKENISGGGRRESVCNNNYCSRRRRSSSGNGTVYPLIAYPSLCDRRMLSYMESGIVKHLQTKDLPEAVICPLNLGSKERQLRNSDLYTTYAVVVCGFSMAAAVFTLELLSTRCPGWFVAADFSRRPCRGHSGVRCEIEAFGRPVKTMYPFSHRDNVDAAASAGRLTSRGDPSQPPPYGFAVADRPRGNDASSTTSTSLVVPPPSPLTFDGKSSSLLRPFRH